MHCKIPHFLMACDPSLKGAGRGYESAVALVVHWTFVAVEPILTVVILHARGVIIILVMFLELQSLELYVVAVAKSVWSTITQ